MMDEATIDDFQKLDLRVAQIISVDDHPNAGKLYVLKIDLGSEQRQLVAGIKGSYKKEDLINKKIIVISNLKAANLRGIESQGMLLAADEDGKVSLLTLDYGLSNGTKIR